MHVVGLIVHGNRDRPHLFAALPHLAGNSNFNCDMRAVFAEFKETGMLPKLHVQASKSNATLCRGVNVVHEGDHPKEHTARKP
eukprot:3868594-Pleurochrysis_carterae.AAC.1